MENFTDFKIKFTVFRAETTSALGGFHAGPLSNWIVNIRCWLESWRGRKIGDLGENSRWEPAKSSTNIWHQAGIEPGSYWWEANVLPSLLPISRHFHKFGQNINICRKLFLLIFMMLLARVFIILIYYMATIVRALWLAAEWALFSCNDPALWNFFSVQRLFWVE